MPVPGTRPKPDGQKRNRVKPVYDWVEVPNVPYSGPVPVKANRSWTPRTKAWWRVVSRMPHCVLWTDSDWHMALDTADVAACFHEGDLRAAAELRLRERLLGTSFDSRRDLRIRYVDPVEAADGEATVTTMADFKALVGA